ncbi:MAG: clan AA aspartic protease [Planctomycetota bacterium]|jgi:clan AA aspartic protease
MGRVIEKIKLTSFAEPEKSVEVEALVDTGAMMLVLPQNIVDELGLRKIEKRTVRYADNRTAVKTLYGVVRLEINGRAGDFDVIAEAEGTQPLLGQIPLEHLDLIVDPVARKVLPNPRSPDMPMVDLL